MRVWCLVEFRVRVVARNLLYRYNVNRVMYKGVRR